MRIVVVDDEKEIADLVGTVLTGEGYRVDVFYRSLSALEAMLADPPDLAILDVMMPEMDGFALCAKLREKHTFPILFLTARRADGDKIAGLSIGADDYITKPFWPPVLVARVKAQLRRYKTYGAAPSEDRLEEDGLCIDRTTHTCTLRDQPVVLTPTEFSILWLLCSKKGQVVSAEEIFQTVWGEKYLDSNNTVMVHIRRLREKLTAVDASVTYIQTVWGVGYKFERSNH